MKISKLTFSATIPTGQYQNIQPVIEIVSDKETDSIKDMEEMGMDYIKDFHTKYGILGELKEKGV